MTEEFNQIIQELKADATNGNENLCEISENKLKAIQELSKREFQKSQQKDKAIDECIELVENSDEYQILQESHLNYDEHILSRILEKLKQAKGGYNE